MDSVRSSHIGQLFRPDNFIHGQSMIIYNMNIHSEKHSKKQH